MRGVLRGLGWIACSVLLVLLVPSSAWPVSDGPRTGSGWSSRSSAECGSPSADPTSSDSPTDPSTDPSALPSDCPTPGAEPTSPETPTEPSESPSTGPDEASFSSLAETGSCSTETPCVVALQTESEAWMGLAAIALVALTAANFALLVAARGD